MAVEFTENMWKNICDVLNDHGINVKSPSSHVGECLEPFVVVKNAGSLDIYGISSYRDFYSVTINVPKLQYSLMDPMIMKVRLAMTDLLPMVVPTTETLGTMYDENIKAHTIDILYGNNKFNLSKFDDNRRF